MRSIISMSRVVFLLISSWNYVAACKVAVGSLCSNLLQGWLRRRLCMQGVYLQSTHALRAPPDIDGQFKGCRCASVCRFQVTLHPVCFASFRQAIQLPAMTREIACRQSTTSLFVHLFASFVGKATEQSFQIGVVGGEPAGLLSSLPSFAAVWLPLALCMLAIRFASSEAEINS